MHRDPCGFGPRQELAQGQARLNSLQAPMGCGILRCCRPDLRWWPLAHHGAMLCIRDYYRLVLGFLIFEGVPCRGVQGFCELLQKNLGTFLASGLCAVAGAWQHIKITRSVRGFLVCRQGDDEAMHCLFCHLLL